MSAGDRPEVMADRPNWSIKSAWEGGEGWEVDWPIVVLLANLL